MGPPLELFIHLGEVLYALRVKSIATTWSTWHSNALQRGCGLVAAENSVGPPTNTYLSARVIAASAVYWTTKENRQKRTKFWPMDKLLEMLPKTVRSCFPSYCNKDTANILGRTLGFVHSDYVHVFSFLGFPEFPDFYISRFPAASQTNSQIPTRPLPQCTQGSDLLKGARSLCCNLGWCWTNCERRGN